MPDFSEATIILYILFKYKNVGMSLQVEMEKFLEDIFGKDSERFSGNIFELQTFLSKILMDEFRNLPGNNGNYDKKRGMGFFYLSYVNYYVACNKKGFANANIEFRLSDEMHKKFNVLCMTVGTINYKSRTFELYEQEHASVKTIKDIIYSDDNLIEEKKEFFNILKHDTINVMKKLGLKPAGKKKY